MNRHRRPLESAAALALTLALCGAPLAFAETAAPTGVLGTTYFATVLDSGSVLPRIVSVPLKVRIDRLSTGDEAREIAELFAKPGGQLAKASQLMNKNLGFVQIGNRTSLPIAAAFSFEREGAQRLVLLVNRWILPAEWARSLRSTDYPFTLIELDIDGAGQGSGEMLPAAQVHFRDDGTLDFRSLRVLPSRIFAVRAFDS